MVVARPSESSKNIGLHPFNGCGCDLDLSKAVSFLQIISGFPLFMKEWKGLPCVRGEEQSQLLHRIGTRFPRSSVLD